MSLTSPDTAPEAARVVVAALRRTSPARRCGRMFDMNRAARTRFRQALALRRPEWDDARLTRECRRHWLGEELFQAVYGDRTGASS